MALLEALTALSFEGAGELRAQIPFAMAQQGCGCGCGTINLKVDETRAPAAVLAREVPQVSDIRTRLAEGRTPPTP